MNCDVAVRAPVPSIWHADADISPVGLDVIVQTPKSVTLKAVVVVTALASPAWPVAGGAPPGIEIAGSATTLNVVEA
jgi:hypothetical protein